MKRIKKQVKAIIFDMDGTIIETEHIWNQATESMLERRGFKNFSDDQIKLLTSLSGIGLTGAAEELRKMLNISDPVEKIVSETKQIAHKLFESKIEFINGFEKFHKKLQKHLISTGVASNADQASLIFLDKKMNLHRFFGKNIYSIEAVGNKAKPKPDIFLHTASQLNVQPYECVVFEDSLFGFQAAKAAGMKCIAIKNETNQQNIKLANHAIDSYEEAEDVLIKLYCLA